MSRWSRQMNIYESLKERFVPQNHPLVIIKNEINFDCINKICNKFYVQNGLGRPPFRPDLIFKITKLSSIKGVGSTLQPRLSETMSLIASKWLVAMAILRNKPA